MAHCEGVELDLSVDTIDYWMFKAVWLVRE